jgi:hypothetical protein
MYMACRHIKPNGQRCKSPALKGTNFCYYHTHLHLLGKEPYGQYGPMRLPVPEDAASIQLSIAKITEALINDRIDTKKASRLLYALQIASHNLDRKKESVDHETVPSAENIGDGEEIAPELRVCAKDELCEKCPYAQDCPNRHDEDPNDPEVIVRTLIRLGKHLDEPCPPGFFPDRDDEPSDDEDYGDEETGEEQSEDEQSSDEQSGDEEYGEEQYGEEQSSDEQSGERESGDEQSADEQSADEQSGNELDRGPDS